MKPRTTLVLIVLLAACIGFIVFRGLVGRRGHGTTEGAAVSVFGKAPVGAKELVIVAADGTRMAFAKDGTVWNMVEPIHTKADGAKVNEIVALLLNLQGIEAEEELGDDITGLDAPLWTLGLKDGNGKTHSLLVGRPLPLTKGDRTYVRPAGSSATYAVAVDFAAKLGRPASEFRNKIVLVVNPAEVVGISVAGRETFELVGQKNNWTVAAKGFKARADKDQVKSLLDNVAEVAVSDWVADTPKSLAPYGLDNPHLVVRMRVRSGPPAPASATTASAPASQPVQEYVLAMGETMDDKVYAKLGDAPSVFQLYTSQLEAFQISADSLRDKHVVLPPEGKVAAVEVDTRDGKMRLVDQGGKWWMESPYSGRASDQAVKALVDRVAQLKAESFEDNTVSLASFGLDDPQAVVTLAYSGAREPLKVLLGSRSSSGEMTFVKSAAAGSAVAAIRTVDADLLTAEPAGYWDTPILSVPVSEKVAGLELNDRPDGNITLVPGLAGTWALSKPLSAPAQTKPVNDIIAAVRNITANRIAAIGPAVPEKYAKDKSVLLVKVTTEGVSASQPVGESQPASQPSAEPVRQTYVFHVARIDTNSYVWTEGGKVVAVGQLPSSFYDTFVAELRHLRVGWTTEEPVDVVRIVDEKETLELRRLAGQWACPDDPHMRPNDRKVEDYIRECNWLRCDRFVSHSSADAPKYGLDKPAGVVEFTSASGAKYRIAVAAGGPGSNRFGSATGVEGVFVLSREAVATLLKAAADFRE